MEHIDLFLSSSAITLEDERNELANYIRYLNDDIFERNNIRIRLNFLEDGLEAIEDSDYFYILLANERDDLAIQAFECAYKKFKKDKNPKIFSFFKKTDNPIQQVKNFMDYLDKKISHYYNLYENLDTIKLNILIQCAINSEIGLHVEIKDEKVLIGEDEVKEIDLNKVPFYGNNENLKNLKQAYKKLEEDVLRARFFCLENPEDEKASKQYLEWAAKKDEVFQSIRNVEKNLMEATSTIVKITEQGYPISLALKKAIEKFEEGSYEAIEYILDDTQRRKEIEMLESVAGTLKWELESKVQEALMRIQGIAVQGLNTENVDKIIDLFQEIQINITHNDLDREPLYNYACFLIEQNRYDLFETMAEKLLYYFKYKEDMIYIAKMSHKIAAHYVIKGNYEKAQPLLLEAIQLLESLNQEQYKGLLAVMYSDLASIYAIRNDEKAETLYENALSIYDTLDSNYSLAEHAHIMYGMAQLYHHKEKFSKASYYYSLSLDMYTKLANRDSWTFMPTVLLIYNSMGKLNLDTEEYEKASQVFEKVMQICEDYVLKNPCVYLPLQVEAFLSYSYVQIRLNHLDMAEKYAKKALDILQHTSSDSVFLNPINELKAYYYLGMLYSESNRLAMAEEYLLKAENLSEQSLKDAYWNSTKVFIYNELAKLYEKVSDLQKEEEYYLKSYEMQQQLYDENPDENVISYAKICNNLGRFHMQQMRFEEAEDVLLEGFSSIKEDLNSYSIAYQPTYAMLANNLGYLYMEMNNWGPSKSFYLKALAVLESLNESSDAFEEELGRTYFGLGMYYATASNEVDMAESYCLKALKIFEKTPNLNVGILKRTLGNIYKMYQRNEEAEKYISETIQLFESMCTSNNGMIQFQLALAYLNLGELYSDNLNNFEDATVLFLKSIDIFRELVKKDIYQYGEWMLRAINYLTYIYMEVFEQFDQCEAYHLESIQICEKLYDRNKAYFAAMLGTNYYNAGYTFGVLEKFEPAYTYLMEAYEVFYSIKDENPEANEFLNNIQNLLDFVEKQLKKQKRKEKFTSWFK